MLVACGGLEAGAATDAGDATSIGDTASIVETTPISDATPRVDAIVRDDTRTVGDDVVVETMPPPDTPPSDVPPPDDVAFDLGADCFTCPCSEGGSTGKPCARDSECDLVGDGVNACSVVELVDTIYPDPVCVGRWCYPVGSPCDCNGLCLRTPSTNVCIPHCRFDASGAAPTGCSGRAACVPHAWATSGATVEGEGYCFGGCRIDADCLRADRCWKSNFSCIYAPPGADLPPGTPCTELDGGRSPRCNCLFTDAARSNGYCSVACISGTSEAACPPGFTCDAMLPRSLFPAVPLGMQAVCAKVCGSDAECAAYPGSSCVEHAGTGGLKTCEVQLE
jgi:hypothetical protein